MISFHAYKAPLIPLKKSDVGDTPPVVGLPTTVYGNAGPGISVLEKRDFISSRPTDLTTSLREMGTGDVITSVNGVEQPIGGILKFLIHFGKQSHIDGTFILGQQCVEPVHLIFICHQRYFKTYFN